MFKLVLSLLVGLSVSSVVTTAQPSFPDTTAGKRARAYVEAFNSDSESRMEEFFRSNVSEQGLKERPVEARMGIYRQMKGNLGKIEVRRITLRSDAEIALTIHSSTGEWRELTLMLEEKEPHRLLGIRVIDIDPPASETQAKGLTQALTEQQMLELAEKVIAEKASADQFSGNVLIANGDKVIFQKSYGLASKEFKSLNNPETRFNLGSINKIFTQVAIRQLADAGKLSLDDKLIKFLPDYPNRDAAGKISIRNLIEMTSGIGDFFGPEFDATPKDRIKTTSDYMKLFAAKPLEFEPGTNNRYSNGGYVVLGAVIEKITGNSYRDYIREKIFKPCGMENTDLLDAELIATNVASGYSKESGELRNNIYTRPGRGSSAGGGYSTVGDMLRFALALRSEKLPRPQAAMGRGVGIAGGAPGVNSVLESDFGTGYTIIVMANYDPPSATSIASELRKLVNAIKP